MMDAHVAEIRAFNRFYTRLVGVLEEHIVASRYTLAEARVLYEIGTRGNASAAEVSRELGIDKAYLSRILQRLIADDQLLVNPSATDRRSNQLALSEKGGETYLALNAGSDSAVAALLGPLEPDQRAALVEAMARIRRLLGGEVESAPIVLRPHRMGELGWLTHRQALLYNRQFGWNAEFEAVVARIYSDYELAPHAPPKALWVAERQGTILGSIAVLPSDGRPGTAQLRTLYVEPDARGAGLGTTLVNQAVSFARTSGYTRMRLWTESILVSARRIYAASGFNIVESEPSRQFGQDLVSEHWELSL